MNYGYHRELGREKQGEKMKKSYMEWRKPDSFKNEWIQVEVFYDD